MASKIGVGLVTTQSRIEYFAQSIKPIVQLHADGVIDFYHVVQEVSPVAAAKNRCLVQLLGEGCDWLFLSEDDVVVQSSEAITGYISACEASGFEHLSFHAHGPGCPPGTEKGIDPSGLVTYWPNYIGAWCIYSRKGIEDVGMFDENFDNCWEHVEHTMRLAEAGYTYPEWRFAADATGSEHWLTEIPGSIENPAIPHEGRDDRMNAGLAYWAETYPSTYKTAWGDRVPTFGVQLR